MKKPNKIYLSEEIEDDLLADDDDFDEYDPFPYADDDDE